jgi:uncharacterized coiled-coil DUF342 family protein
MLITIQYNKLRNYRAQVTRLESEIKEQKAQAASAKSKYADWNEELTERLQTFREEKKKWTAEVSSLRSETHEAKVCHLQSSIIMEGTHVSQTLFAAQSELLAEANKEVFHFQTQIKESKHKIDRLRDYEQRIEQHIKMQSLWCAQILRLLLSSIN